MIKKKRERGGRSQKRKKWGQLNYFFFPFFGEKECDVFRAGKRKEEAAAERGWNGKVCSFFLLLLLRSGNAAVAARGGYFPFAEKYKRKKRGGNKNKVSREKGWGSQRRPPGVFAALNIESTGTEKTWRHRKH